MDSAEPTRTSLRDFLQVLFKRKVQILLFFFATMLSVAGGTFMAKPTYEAVSQLLVKIGREDVYVPLTGSSSLPVARVDREEQINSELEILKSQSLAEDVVKFFGPKNIYKPEPGWGLGLGLRKMFTDAHAEISPVQEAVKRLQEDLSVEGIKKSNVISVSFKHEDPRTAADVTNKLIDFYLDRHLEVHKYPQSLEFFEEQSGILKNKLIQAEDALRSFKKRHDLSSLEEERSLLLRQEADWENSLNQTVSQITETEKRIKETNRQLSFVPKTIAQGEEVDHNPLLISTLQAQLVELQLKEKELLTKYTDQSRLVRNVKEEIGLVREKLTAQEQKRYGKSTFGVNPTHQSLQEEVYRNEAELNALKAKKDILSQQSVAYRKKLDTLNLLEVELNQLQRAVDVHRQNYQLYLTKSEESRISNAMDQEKIANVSLIQTASPPPEPVSPKVMLNLALGLFLGAFGGLGMAFFIEYMDDSLEKPEDVEEVLKLPVLASIPELKKKS